MGHPATSESSNGSNSNSNVFTHDTSSNSVTHHAHYGTGRHPATSESSNGSNSNSNVFTHDTSSNSVTHHAHYGTGRNQYKDNSKLSLTNKIINKSKQKLEVGDIPFP